MSERLLCLPPLPWQSGEAGHRPGLTYAGGLHAADYFAESMVAPSKIVVPRKDYFAEQSSRRVSIMPPFEGSEAECDDLLAFLLSLR